MEAEKVRICGAKTRAGTPCKRAPRYNGRCNLHGGKSWGWFAHPNYKHGWYSKYWPRRIIIHDLNRQGYYRDSYTEYLKLLRQLKDGEEVTSKANDAGEEVRIEETKDTSVAS